jgi:hypothetical protein
MTTNTQPSIQFRNVKLEELSGLLDAFKHTASLAEVLVMLEILRAREGASPQVPPTSTCPIVEMFDWACRI